eukprot:4131832-Alexandrium_andersonii.AAC.1
MSASLVGSEMCIRDSHSSSSSFTSTNTFVAPPNQPTYTRNQHHHDTDNVTTALPQPRSETTLPTPPLTPTANNVNNTATN